MAFIVKDDNFSDVVMSSEFGDLDKPLLVEIIRKKLNPGKLQIETNYDKNIGEFSEKFLRGFPYVAVSRN